MAMPNFVLRSLVSGFASVGAFVLLLAGQPSYALNANQCRQVFTGSKDIRIVGKGPGTSKAYLNAVRQVVHEASELVHPDLVHPELSVEVEWRGSKFSYFIDERVIRMNFEGKPSNDLGVHVSLAHEYGHAVLHQNAALPSDPKIHRRVGLRHDEFFADVFAVTFARDASAMAYSLKDVSQGTRNEGRLYLRDFAINHEIEGWQDETRYGVLAPAKSYVWRRHLAPNLKNPADLQKILRAVLHAVESEVHHLEEKYRAELQQKEEEAARAFADGEIDELPQQQALYTPEELNRRLINEIEAQLSKN